MRPSRQPTTEHDRVAAVANSLHVWRQTSNLMWWKFRVNTALAGVAVVAAISGTWMVAALAGVTGVLYNTGASHLRRSTEQRFRTAVHLMSQHEPSTVDDVDATIAAVSVAAGIASLDGTKLTADCNLRDVYRYTLGEQHAHALVVLTYHLVYPKTRTHNELVDAAHQMAQSFSVIEPDLQLRWVTDHGRNISRDRQQLADLRATHPAAADIAQRLAGTWHGNVTELCETAIDVAQRHDDSGTPKPVSADDAI